MKDQIMNRTGLSIAFLKITDLTSRHDTVHYNGEPVYSMQILTANSESRGSKKHQVHRVTTRRDTSEKLSHPCIVRTLLRKAKTNARMWSSELERKGNANEKV